MIKSVVSVVCDVCGKILDMDFADVISAYWHAKMQCGWTVDRVHHSACCDKCMQKLNQNSRDARKSKRVQKK